MMMVGPYITDGRTGQVEAFDRVAIRSAAIGLAQPL
jgi:hypothetical protein